MTKRWRVKHHRPDHILSPEELVHMLLEARGFTTDEQRDEFLNPRLQKLADPLRIPNICAAVERVEAALARQESILIYTDYDVDGMTSGALLYRFLIRLGGRVEVFVPGRIREGYGLTTAGLERAIATNKPHLLIALDCGTTSRDEIAQLRQQGIDVVVLDHHEIPEGPQINGILVNPHLGQEDRYLATVGIVFKFCHALLKLRGTPGAFDLKKHLDLVALGTVADLAPLQGDNRILVKQGLEGMQQTVHIGLQELIRVSGLKRPPSPSTCGFVLGPRLNASGRISEAEAGWRLLTTEDRALARKIALELNQLNRQRQELEQAVMDQAEESMPVHFDVTHDRCIVVASRTWHPGVVGIVASRLQRRYHRPAIVISIAENGLGKGSCRTIENCSIMDLLRACESHLEGFGGHAMAAGLSLREEKIGAFRTAANEWLQKQIAPEAFEPELHIDLELQSGELDHHLADALATLEPFGRSNPAPVFLIRGAELIAAPRVVAHKHLRFRARVADFEFDAIAFGMAEEPPPSRTPELAGVWEIDDFTQSASLRVVGWR